MATDKDFVVKNGLQVGANTSIVGAITTVDSIQFDLTANTDPYAEGQLAWNADHGTLTLGIDGSDIDLHIGEDTILKVKAAATITKGDVVYASGAVGNSGNIEVTPFIADATIEAKRVIGIAAQNIATGDFGYIVSEGEIRGIDASGGLTTGSQTWSDGDILYASPDYAGELTNVEPTAPNQDIAIAFVVSNNGSSGIIQVRASQLGYNLNELHDVNISSVANNQILIYDAVNSRWNNSDDLSLPGDLTVAGNFTVSGNTTLINTTSLSVEDLNVIVASDVANSSLAEGAGLTIAPDSANVVLGYNATDDALDLNNTLIFSSGRTGYLTNTQPGIYRAFSTTGTYPFDRYGDLVIQARSSHERDIIFVTGLTPANRMVISENGNVGIGSEWSGSTVPTAPLHLYNSTATSIRIQGSNKNMYLSANTTGSFISHNQYVPLNISTHDQTIVLSTDDGTTAALTVNNDDSVTIPTLNSTSVNATTLNGAFGNTQVEVAASYPVAPYEGNMWFDNLNLRLKIYDGSNWQDAAPSGGGGSANTATTDANTTFVKYTYLLTGSGTTVSGASDLETSAGAFVVGRKYEIKTVGTTDFTAIGAASNTVGVSFIATGAGSGTGVAYDVLQYDTSGIENIEVYVNGVKQVEGSTFDYTATTGTSIGFTTSLASGDVVDIQVYELLTNDAYVPKAGGAFEGTIEFSNTSISQTFTNASLAHGMTLITDTDEFLRVTREAAGGSGGVRLSALTDGSTAFNVSAYSTTPSTDGNNAVIRLRASKSNGSTSETALADNEDVLTIGNTGTELVVVKGSGDVGIGTASPVNSANYHTLDIRGNSGGQIIAGSNSSQDFFMYTDGGGANIGSIGDVEIKAGTSGGMTNPNLHLDNDGNTGVQATDPWCTLDVGGAGEATWEGATSTPRLAVKQNDQYRGALIVSDTTSNYAASLHLDRAKGSSTATASGDQLGRIVFNGTNSSGVRRQSGTITSVATASAGSWQPANLEFLTVYNGGNSTIIMSDVGHFYPNGSSQDLGTSSNPWQNIYTQDLVLSNESRETGNDVDGTKGNWTVQEGEDHLYLINNKNGKKYRFALEEIE